MLENFSLNEVEFDKSWGVFDGLFNIAMSLLIISDSIKVLGEDHVIPEECDWCFWGFGVREFGVGFKRLEVLEKHLFDEFRLSSIFIEISEFSEERGSSLSEIGENVFLEPLFELGLLSGFLEDLIFDNLDFWILFFKFQEIFQVIGFIGNL